MPNKPLYVFDANAIISALLLPDSTPRRAFDKARAQGRILLSEPVINELDDVLRRPQLEKYIHKDERIRFLVALLREAYIVRVTETVADCRDPKDNKYLELAHESQASCIVTGDKDLLDLNPYRGISIQTPRQFLDAPSVV
ncbi:MAG: putative toxin-antitoxin system toxin component, PIN family [Lentisphaerae bacterium]|nr:putative toxin-antitoxin system toxin component, PIN family [Lentisphaerota bacterium]